MTIAQEQLATLQVARVKCQKELLFHTRYFFKAQYKRKFIVGYHHKRIAEALERVLSGECTRLIINLAPRYGKTELAVKSLISHGLSLNPSAKFIHLSYSDSLALDNSESIKDLVQTEEYQALFPEVKIKKDSKAKDKWYTTEGGGVLARAAAGSVTGFGAGKVDEEEDADMDEFIQRINDNSHGWMRKFNFNGCIIIDDPIKPEDADSDTQREKVNQRFDSTIRNRTNSRNTPIIVIMQRLHPMDLAGYLQREGENDKWEVLSLPCIQEDGTALWPHKHTIEELEAMKIANDVVFERQYQQNPSPRAGLLFPKDQLNFYDHESMIDELEDAEYKYFASDPAGEGGDFFSGMSTKLIGNRIYVPDVIFNTFGPDHNEPAIIRHILKEDIQYAGIEGVLGWAEIVKRIKESLIEKGYTGEIRTLRPRTGKHARITTRASFIRLNFYFRRDYDKLPEYKKFMENMMSYLRIQEPGRGNKHDDAPDNCEMVGTHYMRQFPELWKTLE